MRIHASCFVLCAALAASTGCVQKPVVPGVDPAELKQIVEIDAAREMERFIRDSARVLNIQYALATASADRCGPFSRPQMGILLTQSASFKDAKLRDAMVRDYSLGEHLGVVYVVPDGAFDTGGVRVGDQILTIDGRRLKDADELLGLLNAKADRKTLAITVSRQSEQISLVVPLDMGCPVLFTLANWTSILPSQASRHFVYVPIGLLRFAKNEDVLAVALAHQFAHVLFDNDEQSWEHQERVADRYGLELAASAGYDVSGAAHYWETIAAEYPQTIDEAPTNRAPLLKGWGRATHFGIANRLPAIRLMSSQLSGSAESAKNP